MPEYAKLSEQPPPYTSPIRIETTTSGMQARKSAIAAAHEILGDTTVEELIHAAHYIATGQLPPQEDPNDNE